MKAIDKIKLALYGRQGDRFLPAALAAEKICIVSDALKLAGAREVFLISIAMDRSADDEPRALVELLIEDDLSEKND